MHWTCPTLFSLFSLSLWCMFIFKASERKKLPCTYSIIKKWKERHKGANRKKLLLKAFKADGSCKQLLYGSLVRHSRQISHKSKFSPIELLAFSEFVIQGPPTLKLHNHCKFKLNPGQTHMQMKLFQPVTGFVVLLFFFAWLDDYLPSLLLSCFDWVIHIYIYVCVCVYPSFWDTVWSLHIHFSLWKASQVYDILSSPWGSGFSNLSCYFSFFSLS